VLVVDGIDDLPYELCHHMWVDAMSCMDLLDCCLHLPVGSLAERVLAFQEVPEVP